MEWARDDGFVVSDDRQDLERVHRWLSEESSWARGRPFEVTVKAAQGSVVLGCFVADGVQVGVARWVSDGVTVGWLCDVFVDPEFRGRGLGEFVVRSAVDHPAVASIRLLFLATADARDLDRRVGFAVLDDPDRWMIRRA